MESSYRQDGGKRGSNVFLTGYPHFRSTSFSEISSPSFYPGFGTTQRTKSISGNVFGPACLPGLMSSPASPAGAANISGMSTANFIHSVSNQIGEIQSRRLPEPPTDEGLASLGIGTIKEELDDEEEAYVEIERVDSGRGTLVSRFRSSRSQSDKNSEASLI